MKCVFIGHSQGKVVCAGSSLFLKRMYGVGYQLTVVKQQVRGCRKQYCFLKPFCMSLFSLVCTTEWL